MSAKTITRSIGTIDSALSARECFDQAEALTRYIPLEIEVDGLTFEAFDCRLNPDGETIEVVVLYRERTA